MAIEVELPGGEIAEFPDDMHPDEITSVLQKQFPAKRASLPPVRTPLDDRAILGDYLKQTTPEPTPDIRSRPGADPQVTGVFGADRPQPYGAAREVLSDPFSAGTLPLTIAGRALNAAASDIGATIGTTAAGSPELSGSQGGNLTEFFRDPLAQSPQAKVLADISKSNPITATLGKIAGAAIESAPMVAVMPQGALGKLVAAGFTVDMLSHAPDAARRLGAEMGKPEAERDMDAVTTALSELAQTAVFTPLTGAHAGGKAIGERVAPRAEAIRALAAELKKEPAGKPAAAPKPQREVGLRLDTGENVLGRPDIAQLADQALREGRNPVLDRGQTPAIEQIRRELNPPEIALAEPTRVAERIEGGGEAPFGKVSFQRTAEAPTTPRAQVARAEAPEGSLRVGDSKPTADSILSMSPESYFDASRQWAQDAMAGKGEAVQIQAELAALREPNIAKWKEGYAKAAAEASKIRDDVKANPASMGDPNVQKRFGGAAQKAQFFQEGLKVLEGAEPNARTKAALEREQALRTNEPKTTEIAQPIPLKETAAELTKFEQEFPGAPKINIAPDFTAMPKSAQDLAMRVGSDPRLIEAYVRNGEVWINADAVTSPAMVRRLALHETGGHWAVDNKLGSRLQKFMEQAHDSWMDSETMAGIRERYPNADKVTLGRELIAHLAEQPMLAPKLWNQIVAQFRQWLRDIGWVKKVSENDIQSLITGAIDGMRKAEKGEATGEGMLSLKPETVKLATVQPEKGGKVFKGASHAQAFSEMLKEFPGINPESVIAGFETSTGRIVDRIEAAKISESKLKRLESEALSLKSAAEKANERFPIQSSSKPGVAGAGGQAAPGSGNMPPGRVPPVSSGAAPGSGKPTPQVSLDDIYRIFEPEKKQSQSLKQRGINIVENFRTGVSSKFRPVNKLAEDIAKAYGLSKPKDIAGIMEQLKGSQGKAEADIYRFDQAVSKLVEGNEKDFNAYVFLRRSLDRLNQDAADIAKAQAGGNVPQLNRRAVSNYTINDLTPKLQALEAKLGPEKLAQFEEAAQQYQNHMDRALRLQVESGRMSPEVYQAIKDGNQFYAPFKVMKYLEESGKPTGSGQKIDTVADYTKAMKGIEDPDFKLGDMLGAARQSITMSRILADKNVAMRNVAELAAFDTQGKFIKRLAPDQEPAKGFEAVNVLENGKQNRYQVNKDVAEAIQLYGGNAASALVRWLGYSSIPFRAGATALNIPFQVSNLLADQPRAALISKYGLRGVSDLVTYPLDFVQSLYSSIKGDVFGSKNKLFLDFLDSGVAGTTVQEYLTPNALKFQEPSNITKSKKLANTVLTTIPRFAQAIEQTSKVLGVKRAMRFEGAESGQQLAQQIPEAITELRRFSGSPDFGRQGKAVEQARLNLIYMFLNARIQGAVADIGRLSGRDGAKTAASTWLKVAPAVGIPTAYLYYLNQRPEYKEDYEKRSAQEKQNYWLIPKDTFITNDDGEKLRDYWRIPKREVAKWFANMTEASLEFAQKRDPKAAADFGVSMLQEISPVNVQGDTVQERMESVAASLNPLIKAPLEFASGRDMYRHRSIVPEQMQKASPEEQYTPRTSEAFKKLAVAMPDVMPESLRSPLILENLTKNLTAGLLTQFLPRKPVEGRTGMENNPLLQRFQAIPYTDNTKFKEEVGQLEREAADEQLTRHRTAVKLIDENKGAMLDKVLEKAPKDEKLMRHVIDLYIAKENGITAQERQILALPTKQRAAYVANQIKDLPAEKQNQAILDYARKRILTEEVLQQMPEYLK